MCRLFGAISSQAVDPYYLLIEAKQSLLRQSDVDPKRKQSDGWGIGWFEKGKPRVFKSPRAMYQQKGLVRRAGERANGKALVGHVRWASNPLKLNHSELLGMAHTQPFVHGKWLFAHNGTLYIPKEVAGHLGPWKKFIQGKNDSEVLFYWLLKHLFSSSSRRKPGSINDGFRLTTAGMTAMGKRLRQSLKNLDAVWSECRKKYPLYKFAYHGLNWVLTNGKILLAFCYTDPNGFGKTKALCHKHERYYQLRKKITPTSAIVASEPIDETTGWSGFRHGELLVVTQSGRRLNAKKVQVL